MSSTSFSSNDYDTTTALRVLERGDRRMVGELQRTEHEASLIRAIQREPIASIGRYQVYTDTSREDRTTVFVHDPSGEVDHKYIIGSTQSHTYVIATPMSWTLLHKNILARVMAATGMPVYCSGGGFVVIHEDGLLEVNGESTDYGAGDHETARAALIKAVRGS